MEIKIEIPIYKILAILGSGMIGYITGWLIYK